ncbi:MAG TPA: hypothetical protein VFX02_10530 [Gammaproteobacteria bacterium]|nr:hypothetical protein [Gammaproteobacteria bacterium]
MSKTNSVFAILAALIGGCAILLYMQNDLLAGQIRDNGRQCEDQIPQLKERYQAEIDALRSYLLEQYNKKPEPAAKEARPSFNQLVSSGHRMQAIGSKYEFLLESALLDAAGKRQLRSLLYQWERLADSVKTGQDKSGAADGSLRAQLNDTETRIRELLTDPQDYQYFLTQRQRDL